MWAVTPQGPVMRQSIGIELTNTIYRASLKIIQHISVVSYVYIYVLKILSYLLPQIKYESHHSMYMNSI